MSFKKINNVVGTQVSEIEKIGLKLQHMKDDLQNKSCELENLNIALNESAIVAITDKNGIITYVNREFCRISKYSKQELIGQNHRILKSGYHSPQFYSELWKMISNGNVWRGELKNKAKDGTFYWVKTTIVPFLDKNGIIEQYISIRFDITDQKELQEKYIQAEKLAVIGELSSRITHDLKATLTGINLNLDLLKLKQKNNPMINLSEEFERIKRSIKSMSQQIDDTLGYVRKNPIKLEKCVISDIINIVLERIVIPNTITVKIEVMDLQLECDQAKIESALTNLIINAVEVIDKNGEIHIRASEKDDHIIIQIQDSGIGIPENIMPKLFDPLFTTKQYGTGLGLASCKNIVKIHNGTISVKNDPTTFTITLPKIQPKPHLNNN